MKGVADRWRSRLEKDLRRRISQVGPHLNSSTLKQFKNVDMSQLCTSRKYWVCALSGYGMVCFSIQIQENDRVAICCLETAVTAMEKKHATIKTCFKDSCLAAIKSICNVSAKHSRAIGVVPLPLSKLTSVSVYCLCLPILS